MRKVLISLSTIALSLIPSGALAEPSEVGTSTIPAGEYLLSNKSTGKVYTLKVTDKGNMTLEEPKLTGGPGLPGMTGAPGLPKPAAGAGAGGPIPGGIPGMGK